MKSGWVRPLLAGAGRQVIPMVQTAKLLLDQESRRFFAASLALLADDAGAGGELSRRFHPFREKLVEITAFLPELERPADKLNIQSRNTGGPDKSNRVVTGSHGATRPAIKKAGGIEQGSKIGLVLASTEYGLRHKATNLSGPVGERLASQILTNAVERWPLRRYALSLHNRYGMVDIIHPVQRRKLRPPAHASGRSRRG